MPVGVELSKAPTHLKMLEKLQELFPEMVEGAHWDLAEGGFRNVLDFLASLGVAEFAKMLDDENLPITHGDNWNELGRDYPCFRQQGIEVNIYDLLIWTKYLQYALQRMYEVAKSQQTGKPGQKKKPGFVSQKLMAVVKN